MIYTVTFNPSIDYIVSVSNFKTGKINRVQNDIKYPGGKGINVSRVLSRFCVKNKALGFIGGFTGDYIKSFLENEGVETDFITVNGDTRINIKLKSDEETEINGAGPNIGDMELAGLFRKIKNAQDGDFIVLAGNVQSNLPRDIYAQLQLCCVNRNIKFIVDATGETLTGTLHSKPFLIKPNVHELGEIFGVEIKSREEVLYYGKQLLHKGAENVIVSMSSEGAILFCSKGIYHAVPPKGIVKNSVGAGDSMIGGLLAFYSKSFDIVEAFRWGTAAGSATAFSADLCEKMNVELLVQQVKITGVN